ncbi:hypothetical protein [Kitasatospora sp. NBC_01302]|uniref:hypothetical protein n=1 Tax=Kitasatospora sp. NBC_01302 TaxID=2903575 RepID=UPI002E140620|nr:hypothetical protein OG294_30170 [Kitasatospora sp. NBC_01302]
MLAALLGVGVGVAAAPGVVVGLAAVVGLVLATTVGAAPALVLGAAVSVTLGRARSADVVAPDELPHAQASARVRIAAQPPAARRSRVRWVPGTGMRQLLTWTSRPRVVAAVPYDDGRRSGSSEMMKAS